MGRAAALTLVTAIAVIPALAGSAAAAEPFDRGVLWRVERPGVPASYVFGTIHLADPRVLELPDRVVRALDASRHFTMEVPHWDGHDWRMFEAAQEDAPGRLEALLGPQRYGQLRASLAARGVAPEVIARLKPWAALANFTVTPEDYGHETLDQKLVAEARARRHRIQPLEGTEEHIAVFEGIPAETQVAMLRHIIDHRDALAAMIEPTLQAWLRRDLAGIHAVNQRIVARFPAMTPHYRVLLRHLVDNRSIVMAHRLHVPLRSGRVFVAVGATHLRGEQGLLRLIEKQGYRVQRVY